MMLELNEPQEPLLMTFLQLHSLLLRCAHREDVLGRSNFR